MAFWYPPGTTPSVRWDGESGDFTLNNGGSSIDANAVASIFTGTLPELSGGVVAAGSQWDNNPRTYSIQLLGGPSVTAADFSGAVLPSGMASFAPGESTATITVNIAGDAMLEPDEAFALTLSTATGGARIQPGRATTTIVNDDTPPAGAAASGAPSAQGVIINDDPGPLSVAGLAVGITPHQSGTLGSDILFIGAGLYDITALGGTDKFQFLSSAVGPASTTASTFQDISRGVGEQLDLSRIDSIASTLANDAFSFIGTAAFNGTPGQLRWEVQGAVRLIQGNVNNDTTADLTIFVKAKGPVDANWFVL